nr:MAG TPA: hypothetical protein [Caudoviricetes sp.]
MINFEEKKKKIEVTVQEGTVVLSQNIVAGLVMSHIRSSHRNVNMNDKIKVVFLDPNRTNDAVSVTVTRGEP